MCSVRHPLLLILASALVLSTAACDDLDDDTEPIDPTPEETPIRTPSPPPVDPEATPGEDEPAPPTDVTIHGISPNLDEPIPPEDDDEVGEVSVEWTHLGEDHDGFRVHVEDCEGETEVVEVEADVVTHGPLNPCRPAQIGVSAFDDRGGSEIIWAAPGPVPTPTPTPVD